MSQDKTYGDRHVAGVGRMVTPVPTTTDVYPTSEAEGHIRLKSPANMEEDMNQEQVTGKFQQLKGKLKETFGRLTDDEIALYEGQSDQFFGKLQEKYGLAKEEAEDRIHELEESQKAA